jgi:hypothetical protein
MIDIKPGDDCSKFKMEVWIIFFNLFQIRNGLLKSFKVAPYSPNFVMNLANSVYGGLDRKGNP